MKTEKAVVLERSGKTCTVLTADGSFCRVRAPLAAQVGQEIEIKEARGLANRGGFRVWAAAAVLLFLALTGTWLAGGRLTGMQTKAVEQKEVPVAILSVDINPSLELQLDGQEHVLRVEALNADARTLLKGVSYQGRPGQEVLAEIVGRAQKLHFLNREHPWVLLGLAPLEGKEAALSEYHLSALAGHVAAQLDAGGNAFHVAAYQLNAAEQKQAVAQGLTPGEYALWRSAQKAGFSLTTKAMTDPAQRDRLLSEPKVQAETRSLGGVLALGQGMPNRGGGQSLSGESAATTALPRESTGRSAGKGPGLQANLPGGQVPGGTAASSGKVRGGGVPAGTIPIQAAPGGPTPGRLTPAPPVEKVPTEVGIPRGGQGNGAAGGDKTGEGGDTGPAPPQSSQGSSVQDWERFYRDFLKRIPAGGIWGEGGLSPEKWREIFEQSWQKKFGKPPDESPDESWDKALGKSLDQSLDQSLGKSLDQSLGDSLKKILGNASDKPLTKSLGNILGSKPQDPIIKALGLSHHFLDSERPPALSGGTDKGCGQHGVGQDGGTSPGQSFGFTGGD
ncbi:Anti-sigma factor RsgI, N-terminal [Acididesulfobacillus acetoxydans]|uniref:Anti-sigma factor N-terminus n=1 Tax=Acididesulfobacillus acetoxydans TaxID=1561005 RepID=A0A8S0XAD8_9FIRM|nr:Anti-sigma factor RsgI, N-terminal [Acididesulfobacillus acetoxydans]CEJ06268.1 Anti-sigma factor N-terminus [Acididesulfobacillus acetoxydans]